MARSDDCPCRQSGQRVIATPPRQPIEKRDVVLRELREIAKPMQTERTALNWNECIEMEKSGLVKFGIHTHTHPSVFALKEDEFKTEVEINIMNMKKRLNDPLLFFCYPYGDYQEQAEKWLKDLNVECAFTCEERETVSKERMHYSPRMAISPIDRIAHI